AFSGSSTTFPASSKSPFAPPATLYSSSTALLLNHSPLATRHSPLLLSSPPNTQRPSPASLLANLPPSTLPLKNASSIASSRSPPTASWHPPTTFPTAASPSPSPSLASFLPTWVLM